MTNRVGVQIGRLAAIAVLGALMVGGAVAPALAQEAPALDQTVESAPVVEEAAGVAVSERLSPAVVETLRATGSVAALLVFDRAAVNAAMVAQGATAEILGPAPQLSEPTAEELADGAHPALTEADLADGTAQVAPASTISYDDWLAVRVAAYTDIKRQVAAAVPGAYVVIQDFQNLPIQFVRFDSAAALEATLVQPAVAAVDENRVSEPLLTESLALIKATGDIGGHWQGLTGAGRSVAVLDTGTDYKRAAFGSCTAPGKPAGCRVAVAKDFAPNDGALDNGKFHGTNVSGIVAGVAPQVKILALDVFTMVNGTNLAYVVDQVAAIDWVVANAQTYKIASVNMSLGDGSYHTSVCYNSTMATAFSNLRSVGILPVVAAGNGATLNGTFTNGIGFPACVAGAVRVGAVYDGDSGGWKYNQGISTYCMDGTSAADQIPCFSQSAPILSLLAPGARISAAGIDMSGTSQAAPHVAAAVAALGGRCPAATIGQVEAAITGNGPAIKDGRNGVTKRRLDVFAAGRALCIPIPKTKLDGKVVKEGTKTKIKLTWIDSGPNETRYEVARSVSNGESWTTIAQLPANSTTYTDAFQWAGYRVRGCNSTTCGSWSNVLQ